MAVLALGFLWLPVVATDYSRRANDADTASPGFRNVTVLIVRHSEKPRHGRGLSGQGEQRAQAYVDYFDSLQLHGLALRPQRLIAASNSWASQRSLLTLKPLSTKLGLPIEQPYAKDQVDDLVKSLKQSNTAPVVLIAWHHGHLDQLIDAFGGWSKKLHRCASWPADVYNWLVVLHFDAQGLLDEANSEVVLEHVLPGD